MMNPESYVDKIPGMKTGSKKRNVAVGVAYIVVGLLVLSAALGGPNLLEEVGLDDPTGNNNATDTEVVPPTASPTETDENGTVTPTPTGGAGG